MFSRSDSLRLFLTGAGADGGAQADPALSLGHYRSSTLAGSAAFLPPALTGILVLYVSQANGSGPGSLTALDANTLCWCAPGDTSGPGVAIANGETALLESGSGPDAFILVSRFSADDLVGDAALVIIPELLNDVFGQHNKTLPAASPTYRALILKNGPTQAIADLLIWLGPTDNPVHIALETPSAQPAGNIQTLANETTAPTGLTFVAPTSSTDPNVLSVPILRPNQIFGLWIKRDLSAASAAAIAQTQINWSYRAVG